MTVLAGCAFIALLCVALFVSGLMPDQIKGHSKHQDTALEEPAEGSSRHSDLIYEQVSAPAGNADGSSAPLDELLPYLTGAESSDSASHPMQCCYIQFVQ